MYKAETGGSTNGKSGVRYAWNAGDDVDAEKGELDHVDTLTWVEESNDKPLDGTKKEIKKWLDDNEVDYPADALKGELIEILEEV